MLEFVPIEEWREIVEIAAILLVLPSCWGSFLKMDHTGWNFLQLENFVHNVSPVEELSEFEISRKVRDLDSKTTIPVSVVIVILVLVIISVMWGYDETGY
jgi:hypothetical protein